MARALRIATCSPLPEPDPDEDLLLVALHRAGVDARMAAWRDPREDWDAPVPTLVRSTWDYIHMVSAFVGWTERVERVAPLFNPGEVMRANVHKRYLLDLARRGVPAVPTRLLPQGQGRFAAEWIEGCEFGDLVVKPAVGAASFGTRRFTTAELGAAADHARQLASSCDVLVQPYQAQVEGRGERALVWIDGQFTHAVRKSPRFEGGDEAVSETVAIEPEEQRVAEAALAGLDGLLYARVDLVAGSDGAPQVMELELVEPSLFLLQHPPALSRLVQALVRRLGSEAL